MRILSLDYGEKTIGVAVTDALGWTAQGVETIFREGLLRRGGTVIVEHAWDQPPKLPEGPWEVSRVKKYGACGVTTLIWRERE